ncbi:MAG: hypothetical protein FJW30_16890 [Acidobacteria bacterium]|nr:hypothetical protein [Acidobacteriota bacterium]
MPIKSYIAYTEPNRGPALAATIEAIAGCGAIAAGNRDALIVVTDSDSEDSETELRAHIESIEGLRGLTLVSAFDGGEEESAL